MPPFYGLFSPSDIIIIQFVLASSYVSLHTMSTTISHVEDSQDDEEIARIEDSPDDKNNKFIEEEKVVKLYIKKEDESKSDYIYSIRVPACDQYNFPGYTRRLSLPYSLAISPKINFSTENEDDELNESEKLHTTLINSEIMKSGDVCKADIDWIVSEMKRIQIEAN